MDNNPALTYECGRITLHIGVGWIQNLSTSAFELNYGDNFYEYRWGGAAKWIKL